jgi:hypothetical protein
LQVVPALSRLAGAGRNGDPGGLASERDAEREFDGEQRRGLRGLIQ